MCTYLDSQWPSYDPRFLSQCFVGQTLNPVNNIATSTNGRAFGGRFRFYRFPLDLGIGRLELEPRLRWQVALFPLAVFLGSERRLPIQGFAGACRICRELSANAGRSGPDNRQAGTYKLGLSATLAVDRYQPCAGRYT